MVPEVSLASLTTRTWTNSLSKSDLKLFHRLRLFYIPVQSVLYRWRQSSSSTCQYCLLDDETVQHFLTDCEHWSRERRLCGITDCDAYVILHGNNIADIKNLLKFVRLTRRLKRGMSIQWSITGSKSYVFARIRAFGLDPDKPSSSSAHTSTPEDAFQ